jgi:hypothetical protein
VMILQCCSVGGMIERRALRVSIRVSSVEPGDGTVTSLRGSGCFILASAAWWR